VADDGVDAAGTELRFAGDLERGGLMRMSPGCYWTMSRGC